MTTEQVELKVVEPKTEEARKLLEEEQFLYICDGIPVANVDHKLLGGVPDDDDGEIEKAVRAVTPKLFPAIVKFHEGDEFHGAGHYENMLTELLQKYKAEFEAIEPEHLAWFWQYLDTEYYESTRFINGLQYAQAVCAAIVATTDKFGVAWHTEYTYNDPDSYTGNHDIQMTWLSTSEDYVYGECYLAYVQVHRGGDARCVPEGEWHNGENWQGDGSGESAIIDLLYSSYLPGITVEIPLGFPIEQYLKDKGCDNYGDEIEFYPKSWEDLRKNFEYDEQRQTYRVQLWDDGGHGAAYGISKIHDCFSYGTDWNFQPQGTVIGELVPSTGLTATPWKPTLIQWSTDGYQRYDGPDVGTSEYLEWLEELELEVIEFVWDSPGQQRMFNESDV